MIRTRCVAAALVGVLVSLVSPALAQDDAEAKRIAELEFELQRNKVNDIFQSKLPLPPPTAPKAISGEDNRTDVVKLPMGDELRKIAAGTCLLTSASRVTKNGGSYDLMLADYEPLQTQCCGGERFNDQKVGGWCSGFLVGKDLVVTAGHCCKDGSDITKIVFIFGFAVDDGGKTPSNFKEKQVYFGKERLAFQLDGGGDFAVIRLDREVTADGAKPLKIAPARPAINSRLVLVGYPQGLPCKVAAGAKLMEDVSDGVWLRTNCDSYAGNSGSCVVDENTNEVCGILVRGAQDFLLAFEDGALCSKSVRFREDEGAEILTGTKVFKDKIPAGP